ncbi:MAG: hypothetical protein IV085_00280 [Thiobacillus sp.]|nr:hypothetical protein [Thiobacillus sp.]
MLAHEPAKKHPPQEWPALLERRRNDTLRLRFARAERVLRANPAESLHAARTHGTRRLRTIFPDLSPTALADVVETVYRARKRRPRAPIKVPTVHRSPARVRGGV